MAVVVGQELSKKEAFALAIKQARKACGRVSPNPPVGCVILDKDYRFLSMGQTQPPGKDHAEIDAIKKLPASASLQGSHFFVTLEPCAHEGRTPSCAKTLAKLPVESVTYGMKDPFPLVDGEGLQILKNAGIHVEPAIGFDKELRKVMEVFLYNQKEHRAFVSLKVATSLDGQVALKSGESQWITGEKARKHSHYIRSLHDAILVGVNTVMNDDPSLDVRHGPLQGKEMKVVILDPKSRSLSFLEKSKLMKKHKKENVFVVSEEEAALTHLGVRNIVLNKKNSFFDLQELSKRLYQEDITSVMVEGGGVTLSQFLEQKQTQRFYQYLAPTLLGAGGGISMTEQLSIEKLNSRKDLHEVQLKKLGRDLLVTGLF